MRTRAVLFDLGSTLVSYYRADEFPNILRRCLRACLAELKPATGTEPDEELFNLALSLNHEAADHAVRPLAERLGTLFPEHRHDMRVVERLSTAFLKPIFATACLDPDAIPVLEALRAQGHCLAIVSNTPWGSAARDWRDELTTLGGMSSARTRPACAPCWLRPQRLVKPRSVASPSFTT